MTIPSRPAPPPPTNISNNNNNINNNNLSQFQQQQQRHHQNGGVVPKLTIKLPPPPTKGGTNRNYASTSSIYRSSSNNSLTTTTTNSSSITRKFPAANVRYAPTTNWDGSPFEPMGNGKKVPPPRPPPPKRPPAPKLNGYSTPPAQSVNILSNLFGRKKSTKVPGRSQRSGITNTQTGSLYGSSGQSHTNSLYSFPATTLAPPSSETNVQLISFDSPPSSPTFTQKSNSDCVSVDSFSSDSNFSSPNNGSVSQPESGFEDDFNASRATTSPLDPWDAFGNSGDNTYSGANTVISGAPIRNYAIATARVQQNTDNPLCNGKSLLPPAPALSMPTIIKPKISQKPKAPKPPTLEQVRYNQAIGNLQQQQSQNYGDGTPPSPPMPNCPPPPPPPVGVSIIDVISGRADASCLVTYSDASEGGQPYGIALYDFESNVEGDLSFRANEKIYILETLNDEWLRGRNRSGCEGIFPINYIDIKVPLNDNASSTTSSTAVSLSSSSYSKSYHEENKQTTNNQYTYSTRTTKTTTTATSTANYNPKQIRSLYTFDAGEPGDLIFQENDLITVLYRINEDWLFGETSDRRQGQFPANFLEYVPDNIPMP